MMALLLRDRRNRLRVDDLARVCYMFSVEAEHSSRAANAAPLPGILLRLQFPEQSGQARSECQFDSGLRKPKGCGVVQPEERRPPCLSPPVPHIHGMRHWFSPPVHVRDIDNAGSTIGVNSVEGAIEQLQRWPVKAKLRAAYPICYGALADPPTSTVEDARKAFEAAAKEAKVLR
ncbi:DUF982 domain-containing protein [Mesorhizobium sp. ESP-6-2]|uniref:DUF982 domain-containing protein n=1 Tax=Mesorhizobium sp. ESP-6-2 TaxID=2876625 RepID=UPI001CCF603B|nr:DUF982 domain-containing protein [Mesorhizobium sp. ESP-6-2]MBZ9807720.1 DUF982 domain-containing protein [Mesorhizobium sp. ESP-6-2]